MDSEKFTPEDEVKVNSGKSNSKLLIVLTIILGVALILAVIIVIGLAAGLGVERSESSESTGSRASNDCTSSTCIALSNQIHSSLDQFVDPCDDFYAFACNGFVEEAILPFGSGRFSQLGSLRRVNIERIRVLMESGDDMGVEALGEAFTYYHSCLQGDSMEVAVQTFYQLLEGLGGWPLVGVDLSTTWSLNNREGFVTEKLYGSEAFFTFSPIPSPRNSSQNLWTVVQSGLTVPIPAAYEDAFFLGQIKQVMMSALTLINSSISNEKYSTAVDNITNFEIELANIFNDDGTILDALVERSNYLTYDELSAIFPQFNWTENFLYYAGLVNININQSAPINVLATDYLTSLNSLLSRTDPVVLENYAKWHFLYAIMPFMSEEFSELSRTFDRIFQPDELTPQRYVTCVENVEQQLPLLIARAFTEVYLPQETRESLSIILMELEIALRERIRTREWLDDSTRQRALSKLSSIQELVAYPDRILNDAFLNEYYSRLSLSMDEPYLLNHLSSSRFNVLLSVGEMDRSVANNRSLWYLPLLPPTSTNAAYLPIINQIYIFEGILHTPIYQTDWPDYIKFATIGYVVGHEYTHGFDNNGRRFNEVGNVENWWSSSSEAEFESRAQCFIDQYDRYTVSAGQVNGTQTLGENIADNGGTVAAYQAYKELLRKTGSREPTLPGLPYSPEQLFFISNAQVWCQVATVGTEGFLLAVDVHSPASIRPVGALSNNREFAAAFSCPEGSPMNPAEKCEIW